jgi:hypothetical protein
MDLGAVVARIPGRGRLALTQKAQLCVEIVLAYVMVRRRLPRADIRDVIASVRDVGAERRGGPVQDASEAFALAARLGHAVSRTLAVLPTDSRCLVRSVVLCRLLADRGMPSVVVIAAQSRETFVAHAWVEFEGRPILPVLGFADARLVQL